MRYYLWISFGKRATIKGWGKGEAVLSVSEVNQLWVGATQAAKKSFLLATGLAKSQTISREATKSLAPLQRGVGGARKRLSIYIVYIWFQELIVCVEIRSINSRLWFMAVRLGKHTDVLDAWRRQHPLQEVEERKAGKGGKVGYEIEAWLYPHALRIRPPIDYFRFALRIIAHAECI